MPDSLRSTAPAPDAPDAQAVVLPADLRFPGRTTEFAVTRTELSAAARETEYETYFRIGRTPPDLGAWTHSLLTLQSALLADLPATRLTDRERADLLTGLVLMSHAALASRGARTAGQRTAPGDTTVENTSVALARWRTGHQIFHLQLTLMNTLLDRAITSARAPSDRHRLPALLTRLSHLYDAATAAMTYAADLDPGAYERDVRPTMEPPYLSPGFSGLLNREHREMARLMTALRRSLKRLPEDTADLGGIRAAASALRAAQHRNRINHVRICEACVPGGVSLLREHLGLPETAREREA